MAPSWPSEDVPQFVRPAGSLAYVVQDVSPFVKRDPDGVVGADVLGQAETGTIPWIFRLEGAKEAVPDNQGSGVIAVDVARI